MEISGYTTAEEQVSTAASLSRGQLIAVLHDVVSGLEELTLPLNTPSAERARSLRSGLVGQVRDHVLPRLQDADAPAIVVIGGSTGAGKSTLVNSVLGREVSEAGVLRPTTKVPVMVVHSEDAETMRSHPISDVTSMVEDDSLPAGVVLIDASDLDSVHSANRLLAQRLLEAADLWLFVTTAARYGDATPWSTLEAAHERGTSIAVVLNRVNDRVLSEVRRDLVTRLADIGLTDVPFFVIGDAGPHEGLLEDDAVTQLRTWLRLLAGRHRAAGLVRRTGRSVWSTLRDDLLVLADDLQEQRDAAAETLLAVRDQVESIAARWTTDVDVAALGHGAPTSAWESAAGDGGPLADLAHLTPGAELKRGFFGLKEKPRTTALRDVADECRQAIIDRLESFTGQARAQAIDLWSAAGVTNTEDLLSQPLPAAQQYDAWLSFTTQAVSDLRSQGLQPEAIAHLAVAASTGIDGAVHAWESLFPGSTVIEQCRKDLAQRGEAAIAPVADSAVRKAVEPSEDLCAALRLRAGELKPFARFDGEVSS
ncbi:GTPase domain-containing protein [Actinomyces vulturis]|uniref:GTPase domain-containing protein n=1 Tax=Actinomyces vulturis TaxID=1857645 RepID=UPI000835AA9A|nr:GTPase domain-containing protein [Actinomyces vulturis]